MVQDCVFCKIASGEIPAYKIYEDGLFLGFLDIRPLNPGNCLIIPKKHYQWVYDVPQFGEFWVAAKKTALAAKKAVGAHSINFLTLGYEVPHAHIRVVPRFDNDGHTDGIRLSAVKEISQEEMTQIAGRIRENLDVRLA